MPPKLPADDEKALFEETLKDVRPLPRGKSRRVAPPPRQPERIKAAEKAGGTAAPNKPPQPKPGPQALDPERGSPGLDRRSAERLRRGQMPIDAALDLHGLTENAAFEELNRFIGRAAAAGRRCILVVTGNGGPEGGVLRRGVPKWLGLPALRPLVLAVAPAQPRHGGHGALYVLLKRKRD